MTTPTGSSGTINTPVSVASSSSAGAAGGSVINVSSLVSQLVAATQAPQQALIDKQTSAVTANISALGTLKSALSTFQSSLSTLSTPSAFNSATATSSDPTVFTASAAADAVSGHYAVTVSSLASAQQLLSKPFVGGSTATVGTGSLNLSVGGTSFGITIDTTNNTVAGVANAINSAAANPGVTATVIQGTDGAHLLLSATLTGVSNTIQVTETDAGNALTALTYGSGNTGNYTQNAAAADASFSVAGVSYTSASNSVGDAISGVTLTLLRTTGTGTGPGYAGSTADLAIANDTSTIAANIQGFVKAYNTLQSALASLGGYDSTTGTAGPMLGNPVLTGTQNQIQRALYSLVGSSSYNSLASIGITTSSNGSLSVNSAALNTALSGQFSAVSQLFSGTNGVAAQLNSQISADLGSSGLIAGYGKTLTKQEDALTHRTETLNTQMAALSASLTQQYSALNTLLSSLQTTSSYLSQAFASLPCVQGRPNA